MSSGSADPNLLSLCLSIWWSWVWPAGLYLSKNLQQALNPNLLPLFRSGRITILEWRFHALLLHIIIIIASTIKTHLSITTTNADPRDLPCHKITGKKLLAVIGVSLSLLLLLLLLAIFFTCSNLVTTGEVSCADQSFISKLWCNILALFLVITPIRLMLAGASD